MPEMELLPEEFDDQYAKVIDFIVKSRNSAKGKEYFLHGTHKTATKNGAPAVAVAYLGTDTSETAMRRGRRLVASAMISMFQDNPPDPVL